VGEAATRVGTKGGRRSRATRYELKLEHDRKMHRNHHLFGIIRQGVRYTPWVLFAYFGSEAVKAIAGRQTTFNSNVGANISAVLQFGANRAFYLMVLALASGTYYIRARLSRRTIAGMSDYVRRLEEKKDPERTSSKLMADGTPTPEDLDGA